jgi:hypothetical protein
MSINYIINRFRRGYAINYQNLRGNKMNKKALLLFTLMLTVALPGTSAMAEILFMRDVNSACNTGMDPTVITVECSSCHDLNDFDEETDKQEQYEHDGACSFCPTNNSCAVIRPTTEELLADAQATTNDYFESLFAEFMKHLSDAGGDFAAVFPDCSGIAPLLASEYSINTGALVRRVSKRTRNHRSTADTWEEGQLEKFESMAKGGAPRTLFEITKPDGTILPTREFESYAIVDGYFRYMRSITMPPHPADTTVVPNPGLPCLLCHGTFDDLAPDVREAIGAEYAYDMALGYKKGDIRGAWTIKIPVIEGEGEGRGEGRNRDDD